MIEEKPYVHGLHDDRKGHHYYTTASLVDLLSDVKKSDRKGIMIIHKPDSSIWSIINFRQDSNEHDRWILLPPVILSTSNAEEPAIGMVSLIHLT